MFANEFAYTGICVEHAIKCVRDEVSLRVVKQLTVNSTNTATEQNLQFAP